MPTSSSSDSSGQPSTPKMLFGRQKPLHELLGGGKVANILLWKNARLSAAILIGFTVIWLLFEVMEYHFLTLLCHMVIAAMLVVFIWSNGAPLLELPPPGIPGFDLSEEARKAINEVVPTIQSKLNRSLSIIHDIACGNDLKMFLLTLFSLWILSVIGSACSFLTFLYFVFLCIQTLPALYEKYEDDLGRLAAEGSHQLEKQLKKLDRNFLSKIPRGPVKERKVSSEHLSFPLGEQDSLTTS